MSDSVWRCRQQPTRLLCPWDSPGKNTGVGCHFLLPFEQQYLKMKMYTNRIIMESLEGRCWEKAEEMSEQGASEENRNWTGKTAFIVDLDLRRRKKAGLWPEQCYRREWADPSISHKITYESKVCGDFWPCHMACGMLFPRPGIEPMPLQWKCSLSHWAVEEVPWL